MKDTAKFHLFNIKALVNDFKEDRVDEHLRFKYLLAESILFAVGTILNIQTPPIKGMESFILIALTVAAVIIGTSFAYKANQRGDNKDFVARYIAVSFVLTVVFIVVFVSAVFLFSLAIGMTHGVDSIAALQENLVVNLTLVASSLVLFYYLLVKYITQISATTK